MILPTPSLWNLSSTQNLRPKKFYTMQVHGSFSSLHVSLLPITSFLYYVHMTVLPLAIISDACMHAKWLQSGPTLCDLVDCSRPGYSVQGILQERILVWVAMHFSRGSSQPRDRTHISYVSCIGRWVLYY